MSEYLFACGNGWLSQKAGKIASKHGATLVNHADPGCKCGHGCGHWFASPNRGDTARLGIAEADEEILTEDQQAELLVYCKARVADGV